MWFCKVAILAVILIVIFFCIMKVAILAMEAEEENLSEEKKLSLGQEVRFLYNLQSYSFQGVRFFFCTYSIVFKG